MPVVTLDNGQKAFKLSFRGEFADEQIPLIPDKTPLIYDRNGVRTLTNVAGRGADYAIGTMKIELPFSNSYIAINLKIRGYIRSGGAFELIFGGLLNYNSWQGTSVTAISSEKVINQVRLGYNSATSKWCLLLNNIGFDWSFYNITVESSNSSFHSYDIPHEGWDISFITDESGITNITEMPVNALSDKADKNRVQYDVVFSAGITVPIMNMNAGSNGQTSLLLMSSHSGTGNNTQSVLFIVRSFHSGASGDPADNIFEVSSERLTGTVIQFTIDDNGYLNAFLSPGYVSAGRITVISNGEIS